MRAHNILGKPASNERLYLKRGDGRCGIKSMKDVYEEIRLRVACYMAFSKNKWIKAPWMREIQKEENVIISEAMKIMEEIGIAIQFQDGCTLIEDEIAEGDWKVAGKGLKDILIKGIRDKRINQYAEKEQKI